MAEQSGFGLLGHVLGGGIDREGAYLEGRYRSAQTEGALASARKNQADAIKQERTNQILDDLRINTPDFANLNNAQLGDLIAAGLGSDFSSVMTGQKTAQDTRLKGDIANPATPYAQVQRNRAAVGDAPFNPIDAVGTQGAFIDSRDPDLAVQPPLGEEFFPSEPTPAIRNYEYNVRLGAPPGPDTFGRMVRADQVLQSGGVQTVRSTGTGSTSTPVDQATVASNAGAIREAQTLGAGQAKRTLDYPAAKARAAATNAKWDAMISKAGVLQSDEALWKAVGLGKPIALIPSTEGAALRGKIRSLRSLLRLTVLQDLRDNSKTGGAVGNVSNEEGRVMEDALAALDENMAPEDFREQLQILIDYANGAKQRINDAFAETYPDPQAAAPAAAAPAAAAPAQAPAENLPTFASEAEAIAAEVAGTLKKGTRVTIAGQTGTWE